MGQNNGASKQDKGGTITLGELKNVWGVEAKLVDFEFDAKFQVMSFDLLIIRKNGELFRFKNSGMLFNEDIKRALNMSKSGDRLVVENIYAKGPDGRLRNIGQIVEKVY